VGTHIPAPSPRRSTQSPVTHQLQQAFRNSASEQVHGYNSSSPACSSDGGDGASAFSTFDANNNPTIVETVLEGNSDDGDGWPEGEGLAGDLADNAQVNFIPRPSGASDGTGTAYDSGLQTLANNATENLVIDTNDPGRANFIISVGALGNASGTPLDGSQNMSFGENATNRRHSIDGNNGDDGMITYSGSESSTSYATPSGYDPSDPETLAELLTRPPVPSTRSPTSMIQFNEQVVVTKYTRGGVTSTTTGNLGGADNTCPSSSLPGSDALRQHANTAGNYNSNGSPNSGDSNRSNSNSNQGDTSGGNDPQDSGPNENDLDKIVLKYRMAGGPLQHWGIQGMIRATELVQFSGVRDPQTFQWVLQSRRHLIGPEIIDRVTDRMHFLYRHNDDGNRVRVIIDGMPLFVLTVPGTKMTNQNSTMLEDHVASTQQMCRILGRHLAFANTLPPDRLPLRVPLLFYSGCMHTHPYVVTGSFDYVKKVDDANVVVIPYGTDDRGTQLVDPPVIRSPAILPDSSPIAPSVLGSTPGTGTGPNPDPNAALLQGVLAAMQVMTQVHMQSDQRNASMTQQQARLQAATLQSNAQQLEHLTNHLGNLGYKVGRAIANHPTQHSHTIQATLSHPNAVPGQSDDPWDLGSLTRTIPVSMSLPTFDYGPYVQAFQPQPNDKNTRRIDKATHQIVQRYLPDSVKI